MVRLGGERCNHVFSFSRTIGAVKELLSLDLGFGHVAHEEDPVDFGPSLPSGTGFTQVGYTYHEDFFAIEDEVEGPILMPIHEAEMEEFIIGELFSGIDEDFPQA